MLKVPLAELNLALTLPSGQAFRWRKRCKPNQSGHDVWFGIIGKHVVELSQDLINSTINYKFLASGSGTQAKKLKVSHDLILRDYFQLDSSLSDLYSHWTSQDANFSLIAAKFCGVRVLRQDPVENLFSFICSSNNNIKRISSMINNLCLKYGEHLTDDDEFGAIHSFPTVESLAAITVEKELRELSFGYRAKFIQQSASYLAKQKSDFLISLRDTSYEETIAELTKLPGVGPKVADCIALMSLDKCSAIPVDTHVYQIAARCYLKHLRGKKSVTAKMYKEIGDCFKSRFGEKCGWAHSVLFAADLKMFKEL